ncbi:uncharacterized protein [Euwallacea fornicatus]|uniref:uncharacterized protein isoform X1 n=2 Tax=Euwallacea fornicatus TaxID=995702 RepID=UPI00338DA9AA
MLPEISARLMLLISGVFLLGKETSSLRSMVIKVPEAARTGDTVTLKCEYDLEEADLYSIKWYWQNEEFYRYTPRESPPERSFHVKHVVVDHSKSGEKAVTLRNLNPELTGNYKCEVSADAPSFHTNILSAHMTVMGIPDQNPNIKILFHNGTKVEIGKSIEAECFLPGSYPGMNFTWIINNNQTIVAENISDLIIVYSTEVEPGNEPDLKYTKSKITINLNKANFVHGDMNIRCNASLFNIYKGSDMKSIQEYPKQAQVLGSTQSQSQLDPLGEPGNSARWRSTIPNITMFFCVLSSISKVVFR